MNHKLLKKLLIDQDLTCAVLAKQIGYTRQHLSAVINGRYESYRAKKAISLALGVKYEDLWGPSERPENQLSKA